MLSGRAIVGALASHQWDAASTPRINITCRLSLLVLYFTLGGFPQEVRFSPLLKNVHLILFGFSIYSRHTLAPKVAVYSRGTTEFTTKLALSFSILVALQTLITALNSTGCNYYFLW